MLTDIQSAGTADGRLRKEKNTVLRVSTSSKVTADEEMARRLHEELNGPELSPAAAAVKRSRKAPTFYIPPMPSGTPVGGLPENEAERGLSSKSGEASNLKSPFRADNERWEKEKEKDTSSGGKKMTTRARVPVYDSAENSPMAHCRNSHKRESGGASDLVSTKESSAKKQRLEAMDSQASQHLGRGTRLRHKDSAQDFATPCGDDKAAVLDREKVRAVEAKIRVTRSSAADGSGGDNGVSSLQLTSVTSDTRSEEIHRSRPAASGRLLSDSTMNRASSAATSTKTSSQVGSKAKAKQGYPPIPKLPMCLHGDTWYRARKLSETKKKVNLDFPGVSGAASIWLPKDSPRIWAGSYKGKDWKHLGNGAWEPKLREGSQPKKGCRGRKRQGATEISESTSSGGDLSEVDHQFSAQAAARSEAQPATESRPSSSHGESEKAVPMKCEETLDIKADAKQYSGQSSDPCRDTQRIMRLKLEAEGPLSEQEETASGENGSYLGGQQAANTQERDRDSIVPVIQEKNAWTADREESNRAHGQSERERHAAAKPAKRDKPQEREAPEQVFGSGEERSNKLERVLNRSEGSEVSKGRSRGNADSSGNSQPQQHGMGEAKEPGANLHGIDLQFLQPEALPSSSLACSKLPGSGLGALAIAMADARGMTQLHSKPEALRNAAAQSSRNRKRAAARAAKAVVDGDGHSPSGHSNGETDNAKSSSNTPSDSPLPKAPPAQRGNDEHPCHPASVQRQDGWRRQWNEKHMQRLQELEEEEKAAEDQDLPEDAQEPYPEQAVQRPMRAIRVPRLSTTMERPDAPAKNMRDAEGSSPHTPVRRAGRGRGRWANHVKKGNGGRGLRPLPTASSQDTPRVTRGGGRGRRGGRWGSRPSKDAFPEDTCLLAFGNIVEALDNRISGGPLCNPHQEHQESCPSILQLSPESFAGLLHGEVKAFRMPPPPVPLFRVAV